MPHQIAEVLNGIAELESAKRIEEELHLIGKPIIAHEHPDEVPWAADIIARTNAALFRHRREDGSSQTRQQFIKTYAPARALIALYYKAQGAELELCGLNGNDGLELLVKIPPKNGSTPRAVTMQVEEEDTGWPIYMITANPTPA
jgi:hypothetical protein